MKFKTIPILALVLSMFTIPFCLAANLVPANSITLNLTTATNAAIKNSDVPVLYPQVLPKNSNIDKYFVFSDSRPSSYVYAINFDPTRDCQGAHYCNMGTIYAQKNGYPQILFDNNNKEITQVITLANHQKAYFTPGHAMADYWNPQVQWRAKNVLYTLAWKDAVKNDLIQMANSAILAQSKP